MASQTSRKTLSAESVWTDFAPFGVGDTIDMGNGATIVIDEMFARAAIGGKSETIIAFTWTKDGKSGRQDSAVDTFLRTYDPSR